MELLKQKCHICGEMEHESDMYENQYGYGEWWCSECADEIALQYRYEHADILDNRYNKED